jgi:predicted transposase YdaD
MTRSNVVECHASAASQQASKRESKQERQAGRQADRQADRQVGRREGRQGMSLERNPDGEIAVDSGKMRAD